MADIQAMYHKVKVSKKHVDFLRFLWWPNGDVALQVEGSYLWSNITKLCQLCFRVADDKALHTIQQNFYVDDEALQMIDLTAACAKGGFRLTKSNSRAVLATIPGDRSKASKELNLDNDNLPVEIALGLHWCVESFVHVQDYT
ncbi:hypothetical protein N1851_026917 [Merluccius polli]|uniref:Uncharacterized protein n=1 Tax=Merluccius polli TaxID=89951 RepID=A0AA47NTK6_MERPO|nr:hypothetical protein N1851_026917 [Merluccius polli]